MESIVWLYSIEKISRWHIKLSESLRFPVFGYFAVCSISPKYPCKIPLCLSLQIISVHACEWITCFFFFFNGCILLVHFLNSAAWPMSYRQKETRVNTSADCKDMLNQTIVFSVFHMASWMIIVRNHRLGYEGSNYNKLIWKTYKLLCFFRSFV